MKKFVAIILVMMLALSTVAFAAEFKDMPNDWSTAALNAAVKNGLLTGSNGYIKASDNMTRAEMATIMVRACGATKTADISSFTDVKESDWFFDSMSKAVAMGAFTGSDNKLNPQNPITRQEAFLVLSRVFGLNTCLDADESVLAFFNDVDKIDDWAKSGVIAIVARGYVSGDNTGRINPKNNISRAEFAVVMDRLIKYYIDDFSDEIPEDGNLMIRIPAGALSELNTDKMVVFGDGMGDSDIMLINNNVSKLVVRGGKNVTLDGGHYGEVSVISPGIKVDAFTSSIEKAYKGKDVEFTLPAIIGGELKK